MAVRAPASRLGIALCLSGLPFVGVCFIRLDTSIPLVYLNFFFGVENGEGRTGTGTAVEEDATALVDRVLRRREGEGEEGSSACCALSSCRASLRVVRKFDLDTDAARCAVSSTRSLLCILGCKNVYRDYDDE
jgi:hypothetical protein